MTLLDSVNTVVGLCGIRLKKVNKSFKAVWTYPKYAGNVGLINHGSVALKKETTPYRHNLYSFSASLVPGILPNIDFHQDPLQNGTCYTSCHCLTLNNLKNSTTLIFFFQPKKDEIEIINKNKHQQVAAADEKASKIWLMQSQEDGCGPYRRKKTWLLELPLQISPQLYELWRKSIKISYW